MAGSDRIKQAIMQAQSIGAAPPKTWSPLDLFLPSADEMRDADATEKFMTLSQFLPDALGSGVAKAIMLPASVAGELGRRALRNFPREMINGPFTSSLDPDANLAANVLEDVIKENPTAWGQIQNIMPLRHQINLGDGPAYGAYTALQPYMHVLAKREPTKFKEYIDSFLEQDNSMLKWGNAIDLSPFATISRRNTGKLDPDFFREVLRHELQHSVDDVVGGLRGPYHAKVNERVPYLAQPAEIMARAAQTGAVTPEKAAAELRLAMDRHSSSIKPEDYTQVLNVVSKALGITPDELIKLSNSRSVFERLSNWFR